MPGELLHQIEGDIGFVRIDGATNGGEVVRYSNRKHFVAQRFDRIACVELRLPQLALLFAEILQLARRQQALVCQHDYPQLFLA
jgi:hypothetical protein